MSDRIYDRPVGYLPAYELSRLHSGHGAQLRSARFGPSALDGDVPVYLGSSALALVQALIGAQRAINSMKVEAETAAQGDEQMMLDACEQISNEGLEASLAIQAALSAAAQPPAAPQEELREDASYESMNLAVMVLSDCGHSSNYTPLLERVAGRIDRHVERLLTAQRADLTRRAQAEPAHPTAGIWVPTELAERVQETMGEFLMDHGWRQQDMDTSDEFGALLAAAPRQSSPMAEKQYPPLPAPDTHCFDEDTGKDVWSYSESLMRAYVDADRAMRAAPAPAAQGDALPREDFAWMVVQEACETEPADEDDPECIRILRRDLKSAVLAAFLREDAARGAQGESNG